MSPPPGARAHSGIGAFDGVNVSVNINRGIRRGSLTSSATLSPGTTVEAGTGGQPPSGALKPIRRRMRMITSCLECRRRKLKCNKSQPCVNCQKFQRECLYLGPKLDEASQLRLNEIKDKVGSLERQLERDVAKGTAGGARGGGSNGNGDGSSSSSQQRILADDVEDDCNEEQDLQLTPMVALDLTYEDCADGVGTDDLIDLGIRVGRMRITERIGGLNRPRISEEVCIKYSLPPLFFGGVLGFLLTGAWSSDSSRHPESPFRGR